MAGGGATPGEQRPGELRVVGTSGAREIDLLLDRVGQLVGKRPPRVLQVGSRTLVADRNVRNWRKLVASRFGPKARFVGLDLVEGEQRRLRRLDICSDWPLNDRQAVGRGRHSTSCDVLPRAGAHASSPRESRPATSSRRCG
jgi:hypothetical protein